MTSRKFSNSKSSSWKGPDNETEETPQRTPLPNAPVHGGYQSRFYHPPPDDCHFHLVFSSPKSSPSSLHIRASTPSNKPVRNQETQDTATTEPEKEEHECPSGYRHCTRHRRCTPLALFRRARVEYGPLEDDFTYCNNCYRQVGNRKSGHLSDEEFRKFFENPDPVKAAEFKRKKNENMSEKRRATLLEKKAKNEPRKLSTQAGVAAAPVPLAAGVENDNAAEEDDNAAKDSEEDDFDDMYDD